MAITEIQLIEAGIHIGLIQEGDVKALRLQAKRDRLRLIEAVTRKYRFPEAALYQAFADMRGIPFLSIKEITVDHKVLNILPKSGQKKKLIVPAIGKSGQQFLVMSDPDDRMSFDRLRRSTGIDFIVAMADPIALHGILDALDKQPERLSEEDLDPIELLDEVMKEVYLRRASDVHFEPTETNMLIRLRVDGQMEYFHRPIHKDEEEALINRIKVLAELDIAEQRKAQDGSMTYALLKWKTPATDIRVATIPVKWGERVTMRILGDTSGKLTLEDLGMPEKMLNSFRKAIERPHGLILVTGPTGSGKSTTLYGAIRELDLELLNVLTAEDPIEQAVEGISQVQMSVKVSFADALRSFLRHDPDVILVGEMRDKETVEIGLRAAMTGHLVMSTLHTNDSVGAVTRLADIGAERFLIGSTLIGVLAQRLARRLCPKCKKARRADAHELYMLGKEQGDIIEIYEPVGCSFCIGSGYRGRVGIFETFWLDENLRLAISEGAGEKQIHEMAGDNLITLWEDSCVKVLDGKISMADALHLRSEGY